MSIPESEMTLDQAIEGLKSGNLGLSEEPAQDTADLDADESIQSEELPDPLEFLNDNTDDSEGAEGQPEQSEESEVSEDEAVKTSGKTIETVTVGNRKAGTQKKVKVDFSDKDKLTRYVQLAHQGNAWKAERDAVKQDYGSLQSEHEKLQEDWNKLESAYTEQGVKGLISLLDGNSNWDNFLDQAIAERDKYESMDPAERAQIEMQSYQSQVQQKEAELQKKYEQELNQLKEQREQTEIADAQTKAEAALSKYGFEGKLGDPDAENDYNDFIWQKAMSNLDRMVDQNPDIKLTQAMLDKEFKAASIRLRKSLNIQTKARTKRAVSHAKQNAASQAQAVVRQGRPDKQAMSEFKSNMKSGNLAEALKSVMTGKVNL